MRARTFLARKRSAADKTGSSGTIEAELDAWQLRIAGRDGTRSPMAMRQ
jgi:hypothetical protein